MGKLLSVTAEKSATFKRIYVLLSTTIYDKQIVQIPIEKYSLICIFNIELFAVRR